MRNNLLIAWQLALIVGTSLGCGDFGKGSRVGRDQFVTFTSELGNSLVAPSTWTAEDEGSRYVLYSVDGHAVINVLTFTTEGSGDLEEFRETIVNTYVPKPRSTWKASPWRKMRLGKTDGTCRELIATDDDENEWRVYIVQEGSLYHAVLLNSSKEAMSLNGEFYEGIVLTFQGVHR